MAQRNTNTGSFVIANVNGSYWTGECWGVREAAAKYDAYTAPAEVDELTLDGSRYYADTDSERAAEQGAGDDEHIAYLTVVW